jgi:hypothetical protein
MTNKTTETTMVTSQVVEASEPPKKPIFPFFPNFNFNFQIPQFPFPPKHHRHDDGGDDKNKETPKLQSEVGQHGPPNVVTFPKSQQVVVVPLPESDAQNPTAKSTKPVVVYQVLLQPFCFFMIFFECLRNLVDLKLWVRLKF